jgi:hypothetical protein
MIEVYVCWGAPDAEAQEWAILNVEHELKTDWGPDNFDSELGVGS